MLEKNKIVPYPTRPKLRVLHTYSGFGTIERGSSDAQLVTVVVSKLTHSDSYFVVNGIFA